MKSGTSVACGRGESISYPLSWAAPDRLVAKQFIWDIQRVTQASIKPEISGSPKSGLELFLSPSSFCGTCLRTFRC